MFSEWDEPLDNKILDKLEKKEDKLSVFKLLYGKKKPKKSKRKEKVK